MVELVSLILIHWIVTYLVDNTIQCLDNSGLVIKRRLGALQIRKPFSLQDYLIKKAQYIILSKLMNCIRIESFE